MKLKPSDSQLAMQKCVCPETSVTNDAGEVLIVDDDRAYLQVMEIALRRRGIRARTCSSRSEALGLAMDHGVKTVVCDYFMPETDGKSLLREIRKIRPECTTILTSAYPIRTFSKEGSESEFMDKNAVAGFIVNRLHHRRSNAGERHEGR